MAKISFSRIVSGDDLVVGAFDSCRAAKWWWRAILWLHGKPTSPTVSDMERQRILADGFRFYAQLYRFLGLLCWVLGVACWWAGVFETRHEEFYWTLASALMGGLLWFASGLGFAGARGIRAGERNARLVLCAFMVAIIAFLSGLTAALSVAVQLEAVAHPVLNLGILSAVWMLGIASYLIEVLYLVGGAGSPRLK